MDLQSAHVLVLETLQNVATGDPNLLKPAEQKLSQWETVPGFYNILKNIFCNFSIDNNVRLLAVLYCKNGVDRYWRKSASNALSDEEKHLIRSDLIKFNEPVNQIAVQIAVLISKIIRYDYPKYWPDLIPTLIRAIHSEENIITHRAILCLYHVIKVLSTKRLPNDFISFLALSSEILPVIHSFWNVHSQLYFAKCQENVHEARFLLEKLLLSLKILHKLIRYGFKPSSSSSSEAKPFLNVILKHAQLMLENRLEVDESLKPLVEKYILRLLSIINVISDYPGSFFLDFVSMTLEFTVYYAFTEIGERFLFEKFLINCCNLLKKIILWLREKFTTETEEDRLGTRPDAKRQAIQEEFLNYNTVVNIFHKIVTHYFLITSSELSLWESDPESFVTEDAGGDSFKYSLRPCMESLFLALFHENQSKLAPALCELLKKNYEIVVTDNLQAILAKDAVYYAIGLAAYDMFGEINFNEWFQTILCAELNIKGNNYRIVRRRIVWLLGKWSSVQLSADLHPLLYSKIIPTLNPEEDLVVRLTASKTLLAVIDCFEFSTDTFLHFLEPIFKLLFNLMKQCVECDTKMVILHVMYFIVERVGNAIEPHYHDLVSYLPILWNESENHNMLRCAIVSTLVNLIEAITEIDNFSEIKTFAYMIIRMSIDSESPNHIYLLEDGLELWTTILENTCDVDGELMNLFSKMPQLLENNTGYLKSCLVIIKSYILLNPYETLQTYGKIIIETFVNMMPDLKMEAIILITRIFELCLKVQPSCSADILSPALPLIFEIIYTGESLLTSMTIHLSVLSRVLLYSQTVMIETMKKLANKINEPPEKVFNQIVLVWLETMPNVGSDERKKLFGLALSCLLTMESSLIYNHFCGILLAITEVLNDLTRFNSDGTKREFNPLNDFVESFNNLSFHSNEELVSPIELGNRNSEVPLDDPIRHVVLLNYFSSQIEELKRMVGPVQFGQLVDTVDAETLAMTNEYVKIK